jgi:hypothetical protein
MSLIGETVSSDFISQVMAPREISSAMILEGRAPLSRIRSGDIPSEDLLWAVTGAIHAIRDMKIRTNPSKTDSLLIPLGHLIRVIGFSRSDARISFFYLLMKECGVFTLVPSAISTLASDDERRELLNRFSDIVKPGD